jgi:hypothetical protein
MSVFFGDRPGGSALAHLSNVPQPYWSSVTLSMTNFLGIFANLAGAVDKF